MHNSIRKYFVENLVTVAPPSIHLQYAYGNNNYKTRKLTPHCHLKQPVPPVVCG